MISRHVNDISASEQSQYYSENHNTAYIAMTCPWSWEREYLLHTTVRGGTTVVAVDLSTNTYHTYWNISCSSSRWYGQRLPLISSSVHFVNVCEIPRTRRQGFGGAHWGVWGWEHIHTQMYKRSKGNTKEIWMTFLSCRMGQKDLSSSLEFRFKTV